MLQILINVVLSAFGTSLAESGLAVYVVRHIKVSSAVGKKIEWLITRGLIMLSAWIYSDAVDVNFKSGVPVIFPAVIMVGWNTLNLVITAFASVFFQGISPFPNLSATLFFILMLVCGFGSILFGFLYMGQIGLR